MLAKIRFNTISSYSAIHDAVCALFETQATSISQLVTGMVPASSSTLDAVNSYINVSKTGHGWTVDSVSGTTSTRNVILKSACKNSTKQKYAQLSAPTNIANLNVGFGRSSNTLVDPLSSPARYFTTGTVPVTTANIDVYVSSSSRHLFITVVRGDTGANNCAGAFEFVTNDGYYTETSPYVPVALGFDMDVSTSFGSSVRALRVPRYKNMRTSGYPDVTNQQCYWETPYSEDEFMPADNGGYDYLGASTDRTPLLVPFGVCNKTAHAFVGGAISDLCDIYLGPTNVGANYEETLIGTDTYIAIPISSGQKRLFIPKG